MGIFSRLTDIVNSNLNAIMDRAEDPEKLIRLIIQEMEDTLVEVRSAAVKAIADRKEVTRRIAALSAERDEWQRKAELALSRQREDLARGALAAKARLIEAMAAMDKELALLDQGLAHTNDDIGKLQAKLDDAKAREKALAARVVTAGNRLKVRARLYDGRVDQALERFGQIERALDELEGKSEAMDLGRKKSLADEIAELETEASVEQELAALKARLAGGR